MDLRRLANLLLISTIAAVTCGCTWNGSGAALRQTFEHERLSADGSYLVAYSPSPDPIPLNEPFVMRVRVRDTDGSKPSSGLALHVDARMPHHRHGMNVVPEVEAQGKGYFRVTGMLMHMTGYWELYLDLTDDGVTERAQFEMELE
jgi:hypothetical protein